MAKLPSYKRIIKSDYEEEQRTLVDRLAGSINDGFDSVLFALNGRLSLTDNVQGTLGQFQVIVDASGVPKNKTFMGLEDATRVIGVNVLKLENRTNSSRFPTGSPFITFKQSSDSLEIQHITGLVADHNYLITIFAYN